MAEGDSNTKQWENKYNANDLRRLVWEWIRFDEEDSWQEINQTNQESRVDNWAQRQQVRCTKMREIAQKVAAIAQDVMVATQNENTARTRQDIALGHKVLDDATADVPEGIVYALTWAGRMIAYADFTENFILADGADHTSLDRSDLERIQGSLSDLTAYYYSQVLKHYFGIDASGSQEGGLYIPTHRFAWPHPGQDS